MSDINIKDVLKRNGISLASVATKLGMGKQNFGQQLDRTPSFDLIVRISNVTNISLDELAGHTPDSNSNTLTCPHCGKPLTIRIE